MLTRNQQNNIAISAMHLVQYERVKQAAKWGTEDSLIERGGFDNYIYNKLGVLMEEVGEWAREINEKGHLTRSPNFLNEIVQVTAVGIAIVEGILAAEALSEQTD